MDWTLRFYVYPDPIGQSGNSQADFDLDNLTINGVSPLPVELTSFRSIEQGENIKLTWQTATEINSDYYAIEHSRDGKTWNQMDMITAAGQSVQIRDYAYTHVRPNPGIHYHRLRIVDQDGSYEYSPMVATQFQSHREKTITAWTTPGQVFLDGIDNPEGGELSLYDAQGRLLVSTSIQQGIETPSLDYTQPVPGIGIVVWQPAYGSPVAVKLH